MADHIEHINQLLDGELEQMLESGLFAELSVNPDLRTEFRNQMSLRSAVQNDRMALVPPAQLTNSVFTGLGFAAPLAGAAAGAAGGSLLLSWLTRIGLPVISALAATGITYFAVNSPQTNTVSSANAANSTEYSQRSSLNEVQSNGSLNEVQNEVPSTGSTQYSQRSSRNGVQTSSSSFNGVLNRKISELEAENAALKDALAQAQRDNANAQLAAQESETIAPNQEYPETPLRQVVVKNDFNVTRTSAYSTIRQGEIPLNYDYTVYPAFVMQVRGFALTPTLSTTVAEQSDWYNNLAVSLMYRLNSHNAVGLEFGNESYPMVFEGDRNGQLVRYEQYPTTYFAGVNYRYTGNNFGKWPIAPFGQVMAGGSKFGPVGRLAAGFEYSPAGPFSFLLGAETSAMAYNYQNSWYVSPKVGVTYGMIIKF